MPPTPSIFASGLKAYSLPAGSLLHRIHGHAFDPVWFGPAPGDPPAYRFDAPAGEYRTLYCAQELTGAYVETILRRAKRLIGWGIVAQRDFSVLRVIRELTLAKLHDEGLAWHGTTSDICAGDHYAKPQALARDLYLAFPALDGIAYRARHNNGQIAYALFDRVLAHELEVIDRRTFADNRAIADAMMRDHGAAWDKTGPVLDP